MRIECDGCRSYVASRHLSLLRPVLERRQREFHATETGNIQHSMRVEPLYWQTDDKVFFPTSLLPKV